ncbi:MAG: glycosyltransferase [Chloroflexi bacterium]|nr:glycosyltransferase [Chloroflexota bacterium]
MSRRLVIFGLSLSSSWGNGHAIPFRGLCRELAALGWEITFFERDVEWYRSNRDVPSAEYCDLRFYEDWRHEAESAVAKSDTLLVGSYVPDGAALIDWLLSRDRPVFFYDIDTPVTLTALATSGHTDYLRGDQIPHFETYFSFTGGPALDELEKRWHARRAEALFCGVDPLLYYPVDVEPRFRGSLGYMGTYAPDRQARLEAFLLRTAERRPDDGFLIAGPQYPPMRLPPNVRHIAHLYPREHAAFYSSTTATLNLTRDAMRAYGWSPASRLFEAAACGACIISDTWPGLDHVLEPGREVLLANSQVEVEAHLDALTPARRQAIGTAARCRVMAEHTFAHRAAQLHTALERTLVGTPAEHV